MKIEIEYHTKIVKGKTRIEMFNHPESMTTAEAYLMAIEAEEAKGKTVEIEATDV